MNGSPAGRSSDGRLFPICDDFDNLNGSEDRIIAQGYAEGVQLGSVQGNTEGWAAGLAQGGKVGLELGNYNGFCSKVLDHLTSNPTDLPAAEVQKLTKLCEKILLSITEFPVKNVVGEDLMLVVSQIRGQVTLLKSSLKLSTSVGAGQKFSF